MKFEIQKKILSFISIPDILNFLFCASVIFLKNNKPQITAGDIFLVLLLFLFFLVLRSSTVIGKVLYRNEKYLLSVLTGLYIAGSVLLKNFWNIEGFPVSLAFPTGLFIMILAVLMGTRSAIIMALALPAGAFFTGTFDYSSFIIAVVSGVAASAVIHNTHKRMGLIIAGFLIAAANCFAVGSALFILNTSHNNYSILFIGAVLNGIISGMLTLGFLPLLEYIFNTITPFRLMELSDLNVPVLRELFTKAPGTYIHSLMVANLAEQACRDIGANSLLARVGSYYHDIGKTDNPDYFIENQDGSNIHDNISPRLSTTIIRSHVKIGTEKAIRIKLPKDIISIISEHHGNSVISWFYNKAAEQEEIVNPEDFTYPGNPPRSKESAVVMLADVTEAAVRTLNKPTAVKIEKFIKNLFEDKVKHGQLSESDLSFSDLEKIKKAFVKTLAGHYHSRIEYRNFDEQS
jgi:putative nucleotidyltransferase with HDIG domain